MTADDLKSLLESTASGMDDLSVALTPKAAASLDRWLTAFLANEDAALALAQLVDPTLTKDELDGRLRRLRGLAAQLARLAATGDLGKMADAQRRMASRRIVLNFIARRL